MSGEISMKVFGQKTLVFTFVISLFGCDGNVTISKQLTHYDPKVHLSILGPNELLPKGVRELLAQQSRNSDSIPKFPVSYYLIPEEDSKFLRTKNFNTKIADQLIFTVSGEKYFKLFVHPDSDKMYSFLKHGYRYIGPSETEFMGSPIGTNKTLVVWVGKNLNKMAFVVKTKLDAEKIQQIGSRFPAAESITLPEMASLIFKRSIKGSSEKIEGQQITELP